MNETTEKNIAMIMAGGVGARMNSPVPKQFHMIKGKPVIVYTIEAFQLSAAIDEIVIVTIPEWREIIGKYIEKYQLHKVTKVVDGGSTGFESIQNGVKSLSETYRDDDVIIIHDAVRPLVSEDIINNNIIGVQKFGNAITSIPATEALLYSDDGQSSQRIVDRDQILRTQTPQSLRLGKLVSIHNRARELNITDSVATCTLLIETGHEVYSILGETSNFKITMPEDVALFEAYLDAKARARIISSE